ncbi:MAG: DUF4340 domain-containing protein [Bryobacterales bacterium]|nr:DUF4340 domain-containing protein [Bryobacterales bacterium]
MKFRGLLLGAGALALLLLGTWYSNKLEKEKENKPAPDAPPKIVEISRDDITQIEIARAGGGETTTIKRGAGNQWEITSPKPLRADQDSANTLADTFKSLASDRLIEEKATDLASFGLAEPKLTVTVSRKDGKTAKLLLGDETPASGGVFVKLDNDARVFTLASFNKSSLEKVSKDLMDRRLLTFDSDKLTRLELASKGASLEFGKNNAGEWQILKPKPMRADGGNVEELVRRLKEAKMDTAVAEDEAKKAAADFAGAAVAAVAKVTDAAGTQTIEVRKAKDNTYYARGSALDGIYKVTADLGDGVSKSLSDFRMKKVFEFGWNDPSKVEVKDGWALRTFTKDGGKWKEGAKEMDAISVQALIDKLRDLAATNFLDAGAGTPFLEATVVAGAESKKTEKVLFSRNGEKFFAVRDGEPAMVYEIAKQAVEDIQRAAKDVKAPSATPAATKSEAKK